MPINFPESTGETPRFSGFSFRERNGFLLDDLSITSPYNLSMESDLDFYRKAGVMTTLPESLDPGTLPVSLPLLVEMTQNMLVHIFWAERYGLRLSEMRKNEVNLRTFRAKEARLQELDAMPFTERRSLEKRLVGNCRDFSVILASLLKARQVPARARCGFGTYFLPNHYEDHWVVEYWNAGENHWVMVDAQLDEFQKKALKITFDPLDVPPYKFITGAKAWMLCRAGQADPEKFGIFDMKGLWFVRGNLVRDFLALNNIEILPWDVYGIIAKHDNQITESDITLLDRMAGLCLNPQGTFAEIRSLFTENPDLQPPPSMLN